RAFWFYLAKIVWPANLTLIYPRWKIDSTPWFQFLFPVGALWLVVSSWLYRKAQAWLFVSVAFFVPQIAPLLGFFYFAFFRFSFVADHFQYLPSLGVIVPVAAGMTLLTEELGRRQRWMAYALCGVFLGTLCFLSWRQAHAYQDSETC